MMSDATHPGVTNMDKRVHPTEVCVCLNLLQFFDVCFLKNPLYLTPTASEVGTSGRASTDPSIQELSPACTPASQHLLGLPGDLRHTLASMAEEIHRIRSESLRLNDRLQRVVFLLDNIQGHLAD